MRRLIRRPSLTLLYLLLASSLSGAWARAPEASAEAADEGAAASKADDGKETAKAHFLQGVSLYQEADFRGALIEFKRAYEIAPNYRVLFNTGTARLQLQDYAGALRDLNAYLDQGGDEIPKQRRAEVEAELERLNKRIAFLTINSPIDGVEIRVDGEPLGQTPFEEALVIGIGRRALTAWIDGQLHQERRLDVASGDQITFEVTPPEPEPASLPASLPTSPLPPPDEPLWPWYVTGALAVGALAAGGLALQAEGDLEDARAARPGDRGDIDDKADKLETLALTTDVLIGGAALMGAVATWMALSDDEAPVEGEVQVQISPMGLGLQGAF